MRLKRSGLEKDLERWHALGWISDDGAAAIAGELALRPFGFHFGAILSLLGAALLCFAAMTFVAANWSDMAKVTRLAVLFGALWASYGVAWVLFRRGLSTFAHCAVLVGSGVFGACIMLIAQTYHMEGHPPDAVLLWAAGALAAAVLMRSVPSLVLAIGLFALWAVWDIVILETPPAWPYWTTTAVCAAACLWLGTRVGFHALLLGLFAWFEARMFQSATIADAALFGCMLIAIGLAARTQITRHLTRFQPAMLGYGTFFVLMSIFQWQFMATKGRAISVLTAGDVQTLTIACLSVTLAVLVIGRLARAELPAVGLLTLGLFALMSSGHAADLRSAELQVMWGGIMLVTAVWFIALGLRLGRPAVSGLGFTAFGAELIYAYAEVFGDLMDTAAFYLVAGIAVIAMGAVVTVVQNRRPPATGETA